MGDGGRPRPRTWVNMRVHIEWTITDGVGDKGSMGVYLPETTDLDSAMLFLGQATPIIQALTKGYISNIHLSADELLTGAADIDSDITEFAFFALWTAAKDTETWIPAFDETKILPNSKYVNMSDSDVAAWVTMMTQGLEVSAGVTVRPVSLHGEYFEEIERGYEDFDYSRKARRKGKKKKLLW